MAKKKKISSANGHHHWFEFLLILLGAFSILFLMALISYHPQDQGFFHQGQPHAANVAGHFGAQLADILLTLFGFWAYCLPFLMLLLGWQLAKPPSDASLLSRLSASLGFTMIVCSAFPLLHLLGSSLTQDLLFMPAGYVGDMLASSLIAQFNQIGAVWVSFTLLIAGLTLFAQIRWLQVIDSIGAYWVQLFNALRKIIGVQTARVSHVNIARHKKKDETKCVDQEIPAQEPETPDESLILERDIPKKSTSTATNDCSATDSKKSYDLPKLSLLDMPKGKKAKQLTAQQVEAISRSVEAHLQDFGIKADVVGMYPGPVVTCFELQLAAGTKVSKVSGLAKDLARSLSVTSVRVVEVLPGKPYIGLEIPNESREMVLLSDIIGSKEFLNQSMSLPLALGKDIAGKPIVADLAKMPHCLVAGTTGSGKSVGINAMLLGLLYDATPEDVRMILIDPKMLELSIYDGIPHLLTPVVTDMKDAGRALSWCVYEMERRYRLMAVLGVRNLAGYNALIKTGEEAGEPLRDPFWKGVEEEEAPLLEKLPSIVVCADEFADMIMVVGKKVEEQITRLAQKARAAGIHLILATQRPSVDVITGLIKANIPTRIAFQVSSKIDSRTVLDQQGAEQLLGQGDMLYLAPGTGVPIRVHGAYVGDDELHRITKAIKAQGDPDYLKEITDESMDAAQEDTASGSDSAASSDRDALFGDAVKIVVETKRASISNIQRRLKIGYNRAARIVDQMEEEGIVSPMDTNGSRTLLVNEFEGQ